MSGAGRQVEPCLDLPLPQHPRRPRLHLVRQGVDVRTVMTLLGHTAAEMTLTGHARLSEGAEDDARARLDELWFTPKGHGRATGDGAAR